MKLAIFLCFIAFASVAQGEGWNIGGWLSKPSELLNAATEKLEATKNSANEQITRAVDTVKEKVGEPQKQVEELVEKLKDSASGITSGVTDKVEQALDDVNKQVDEITSEAEKKEVDVTECKSMTKDLKDAALNIVTKTSRCVTDKIDQGKSLVKDIIEKSTNVITEVNNLRNKYNECFADKTEGIIAMTTASACISKTGLKATMAITKDVPSVASDIAKITTLVTTLQSTLPTCVSTNLITSLAQESKDVLGNVKNCVSDKVKDSKSA